MNNNVLRLFGVLALSASLMSCNDFLSQEPDDRTQINDVKAAKELATTAYCEYSYIPLFELRSDNVVDKGTRFPVGTNFLPNIYLFDGSVPSTYQDSPQGFWRSSYGAIAAANQTLFDLNRTRATGAEADAVRGEVLIARAYAMYMLAQAFTIPYDPATATTALGLPYPTEPEEELIKEYKRGTLQETYDLIVKDFEDGYKLVGDEYAAPKFHFTRQASAAFGARLYRTLQQWDKVLAYGKDAFGDNIRQYIRKPNQAGSDYQGTYAERNNIWSMETEPCNFLVAVSVSSWSRYFYLRYALNVTFKELFTKGQNFLNSQFAFTFFGNTDYANIPKVQEHFKVTNQATGTGFVNVQSVLLSGDETLFNMAEAYVMKGDFAKAEELMQIFADNFMVGSPKVTKEAITSYYQSKVDKKNPDPLHGIEIDDFSPAFETSPEQEMYLRACLDLKRIAFIHDGLRWLDNRQYRMDIVHNVFSEGNAKEEFVVLKGTDPRYAFQLPDNVLPYLEKNPGYDQPIEPISK